MATMFWLHIFSGAALLWGWEWGRFLGCPSLSLLLYVVKSIFLILRSIFFAPFPGHI